MKRYGLLILLLVVFLGNTSCTKYYYSILSTEDPSVYKNHSGDFIVENDSVGIIYNFHGEDLPIRISVFNKTDKPMYVDWGQSALIVKEGIGKELQAGHLPGNNYNYKDYARGEQPSDGLTFIPPHGTVQHTPLVLSNFAYNKIPSGQYEKKPFTTPNNEIKQVKVINYSERDTPLLLRSYLTVFTVNENGKRNNSMSFDSGFYISLLIKGGAISPSNFKQYAEQRGDFFFVRDERGKNAGIIVGLTAIGVAGVVLEATSSPHYHYYY